ncbi:hypothetical protein [Pseudomonas sp. KU26590]|uniref:hypothetical protein n=1 Tax=Pseudomonas sp. KU26590 TaxID=2991051 RepID=UPI0039FD971F
MREIVGILDPQAVSGQKSLQSRSRKKPQGPRDEVYKNPPRGEVVGTKGGNHELLKAWKNGRGYLSTASCEGQVPSGSCSRSQAHEKRWWLEPSHSYVELRYRLQLHISNHLLRKNFPEYQTESVHRYVSFPAM